jgi:hypothetical protein
MTTPALCRGLCLFEGSVFRELFWGTVQMRQQAKFESLG